ncbi:proteasome assembly chaperone family protein [Halobacteriales archaeon Cl-PHB]
MAHVEVHVDDLALESPMLAEGLPGVGLVGKLAADHLVRELEMDHVASCRCEGLPRVAIYGEDERSVKPPVRIYADRDSDLLALQSDVPVSPTAAGEFATCITGWFAEQDVTPIYLVGMAAEKQDVPEMYGVGTADGPALLSEHDVAAPDEMGMVSGPTGALIAEAESQGLDSVGLIVESNPQFPDPEAARILIQQGIGPIAGVDVATDKLVEQAEEIADARQQLAQQMQEADEESSQAQPLGMYQ